MRHKRYKLYYGQSVLALNIVYVDPRGIIHAHAHMVVSVMLLTPSVDCARHIGTLGYYLQPLGKVDVLQGLFVTVPGGKSTMGDGQNEPQYAYQGGHDRSLYGYAIPFVCHFAGQTFGPAWVMFWFAYPISFLISE